MARKRLKRIHINQHMLRKNTKEGTSVPVISVKAGKENHYTHQVILTGPSELIYTPHRPQESCGARLMLKTSHTVIIDDGVEVN